MEERQREYLIPANSKKGMLIFSIFTPKDLLLFSIGAITSFILVMIVDLSSIWRTIFALSPVLITGALVAPIPNYHNSLTALKSLIDFFSNRRRFIWKGWSVYEKLNETK
jgi:hypothetical protein